MEQLWVRATFPHIPSENLARFKQLVAECIEIVKEKDSGTLAYDWFFSDDETTCVAYESYVDSDALVAHVRNLGDLSGEVVRLAGPPDLELFGDPSDAVRRATATLRPRIYSRFAGL